MATCPFFLAVSFLFFSPFIFLFSMEGEKGLYLILMIFCYRRCCIINFGKIQKYTK